MSEHFKDTRTAPAFTPEKMNKVGLFATPRLFCDVYCLLPGQSQRPHAHAASDKIYHVLTGQVRVQIGETIRELAPGEIAHAPEGVEHGLFNDGDADATVLVMMAPHPNFAG